MVQVHHAGEERGLYYLTMDLVVGADGEPESLEDRLKGSGGRLKESEARRIALQICDALEYAHGKKVVHRDLKPANVLLEADGSVRVTDFGLAKVVGSEYLKSVIERSISLSLVGGLSLGDLETVGAAGAKKPSSSARALLGTYDYMAPEQKSGGEVTPRTDIYAFGVLLYRMLTGQKPEGMAKPPSHYGCSKVWDPILQKCLEPSPADRYPSVTVLRGDIEQVGRGRGTRRVWAWAAAGVVLAAVVWLGSWWGSQRGHEAAPVVLEGAVAEAQARERQAKIAGGLTLARQAKEKGDWEGVLAAAEELLKLDGENREAQGLKREAEENLVPWWRLITTVDGQEARGKITVGGQAYTSPATVKLEEGKQYTAEFSYEAGGRRYRAHPVSVTADWRGVRQQKVALEESKEPKPGEEFTLDLGGGVKMVLCWIPPGRFLMGSPEDEPGRDDDEGPQHEVTITSGFWMGKYEVTQRQYQQLMGENPSYFKNAGPDAPVESVTWHQAMEFCKRLQEKLPAELRGKTVRLPTEAEWEYACRAGTTTALNNGKPLTSTDGRCPNLDEVAWYVENSGGTTKPVGQKRGNAWGRHDMLGNVWEWCWDGVREYTREPQRDPMGNTSAGSSRVVRGGSWDGDARYCRSSNRRDDAPGSSGGNVGFRVVVR